MTPHGLHHLAHIGREVAAARRSSVDVLGRPVVTETRDGAGGSRDEIADRHPAASFDPRLSLLADFLAADR